jgi:hypothetical protein
VRGFLAGTVKKKLGFPLTSLKPNDGVRRMRSETKNRKVVRAGTPAPSGDGLRYGFVTFGILLVKWGGRQLACLLFNAEDTRRRAKSARRLLRKSEKQKKKIVT